MIDPKTLQEYIDELGLEYRQTPKSYIFDCPKCGKGNIIYAFKSSGYFKCMKEGWEGPPHYLIAELTGLPLKVIAERLYGKKWENTSSELVLNWGQEEDLLETEILHEIKWPFDAYEIDHKFSKKGLDYLLSRGIDLKIAIKYKIRYSPSEQRVLFPVISGGKLYGYQGRLIVAERLWSEEDEKFYETGKVKSSDNLPSSRLPMFADNLIGQESAILSEGPFDALKFEYCDAANLASMGKTVSAGQIAFIKSKGIKNLYLAQDEDAFQETMALASEFNDLNVFHVQPLPGKDFGAMSFEECNSVYLGAPAWHPGRMLLYFK